MGVTRFAVRSGSALLAAALTTAAAIDASAQTLTSPPRASASAAAPQPPAAPPKSRTVWGFAGPAIASTLIGLATLPVFVLFTVSQSCPKADSSTFEQRCSRSTELNVDTALVGVTTFGHLAVAVAMLAKSESSEPPAAAAPSARRAALRIVPHVGLGFLGVRGTW